MLLFVAFGIYFLRPDFVGMDSYGHLLLTCQNNNAMGATGIPFLLFDAIPCNLIELKMLLFCCAFVSGCFIIKMAMLFSKEHGWRASYLIFLSPVLVLEFSKFENDAFAFPILFASLYFFFKSLKANPVLRKEMVLALALLIPAGLLWSGSWYFLVSYSLNFFWLGLISVPAILLFRKSFVGGILRTSRIAEDMPFLLHVHWVLILGFAGVILSPLLLPQAVFFFAMGLASAKFWILSLPFLVCGAVLLHERLNSPSLNTIALVIALFAVVGTAQSIMLNPPTESHWQALEFANEISDGNYAADWGYGYWRLWAGHDTNSYGTFWKQEDYNGMIAVSEQPLGCPQIKQFGKVGVWRC